MKQEIKLKDIIAYFQGKLRYKLYYSKFAFLIRPHIKEQIDARINSMDKSCYDNGECVLCGCQTTALQMADKACDKPCYPSMLSKQDWKMVKKGIPFYDFKTKISWVFKYNKFVVDKLFPDNEGYTRDESVLNSLDLSKHKEC